MINKIITILVISFIFFSCTKAEPVFLSESVDSTVAKEKIIQNSNNSHVSINDIHDVIARDYPATKGSDQSYTIEPYVRDNSDTLMYIVNMDNNQGWKIYSSDKRVPAVLAEGEKGCFSIEDGGPAVSFWLKSVADNMALVKAASDSELLFNDTEIYSNKSYWPGDNSRVSDGPIIVVPNGHWEETITTSTAFYDSVEHMVGKWHQKNPYNGCCPYYVDIENVRAKAGCVAVAGAQVLFYLHDKLNVPAGTYSECTCVGNVDNYYREFSGYSASAWSSMSYECHDHILSTDPTVIPEAILIGYVGQCVDMHYHQGNKLYSWALPVNLKTQLFEPYGINCYHDEYDEEIVKNSLENEMPVIISASDLLVPVDGDIHCFVIDGYRKTRTKYTHNFHFVLDEAPGGLYEMPEDYTTYTYSDPEITSIKINWGWDTQWGDNMVNDGWYTLTDSWVTTQGDYDHYRKMIYGFSVAQ